MSEKRDSTRKNFEYYLGEYFEKLLAGTEYLPIASAQPGMNKSCSIEFVDGRVWPRDLGDPTKSIKSIWVMGYMPHGIILEICGEPPEEHNPNVEITPENTVFVPYNNIRWISANEEIGLFGVGLR